MVSFHNVPVFSCLIIKRIYSIFRFKRGTCTASIRGTGIPKCGNRQSHAMINHSINLALKIPTFLKSASFRIGTFGERICYI